jgi:hypothetical protein
MRENREKKKKEEGKMKKGEKVLFAIYECWQPAMIANKNFFHFSFFSFILPKNKEKGNTR